MKELTIEQKAKAYDEAIEKFDVILNLNTVKESGTIFADDVRKIFPELKESEDEKIRKAVVDAVVTLSDSPLKTKMLSWLEKQGEHANFINKIQIGYKVTRNEDGVLVNLSQLKRVAKPADEKQGEKPNNVYDKELSEILGRVIRRYINDPNIPYTEREKVSMEIIPYVERLEKQCENISLPKFTFDDVLALQCCMETAKKVTEDKELYEKLQSLHNRLHDAYWFEKQGEQKPIKEYNACEFCEDRYGCVSPCSMKLIEEEKFTNKVEPKFKIEEEKWYVCTQTFVLRGKIVVIKGQTYQAEKDNVIKGEDGCLFIDKHDGKASDYFRLWTIQDAKDGDVLCGYPKTDYPWIGIFHNLNTEGTFNSYCFLQAGQHGKFCPPSEENIFGKRNIDNHISEDIVPATKEQRDTLMNVMADAGYEWNAEKKELRKIEQKTNKCIYSKDNYTDEDRKALCDGCEEECIFNKKEESINNGLDLGCGVIWKDEEPVIEPQVKESAKTQHVNKTCKEKGNSLTQKSETIDFEQELYKYFGQVKDFTLGIRIAKRFYEIGKKHQEPVSEKLEQAIDTYLKSYWGGEKEKQEWPFLKKMVIYFAKWQKQNLWKPADGEDLPELERDVIVLTQPYPLEGSEYAVSFGHRPNPNGWDRKSITTGEIKHYTPETYDKRGWNIPDIKWWLDIELQKEIEL